MFSFATCKTCALQVSDQCMGLVKDNCLIPTYDASELGYVKESSNEQYVPDIFSFILLS